MNRKDRAAYSVEEIRNAHAETVAQLRALLHALSEQQNNLSRMLPKEGIFSGDCGAQVSALLGTHVLNTEPLERTLDMLCLRLSSLAEDCRMLLAAALRRGRSGAEEQHVLTNIEKDWTLLDALCHRTLPFWRRESMRAADLEGEGKHASATRLSMLSRELTAAYQKTVDELS